MRGGRTAVHRLSCIKQLFCYAIGSNASQTQGNYARCSNHYCKWNCLLVSVFHYPIFVSYISITLNCPGYKSTFKIPSELTALETYSPEVPNYRWTTFLYCVHRTVSKNKWVTADTQITQQLRPDVSCMKWTLQECPNLNKYNHPSCLACWSCWADQKGTYRYTWITTHNWRRSTVAQTNEYFWVSHLYCRLITDWSTALNYRMWSKSLVNSPLFRDFSWNDHHYTRIHGSRAKILISERFK
jgi:hypothetical protein